MTAHLDVLVLGEELAQKLETVMASPAFFDHHGLSMYDDAARAIAAFREAAEMAKTTAGSMPA